MSTAPMLTLCGFAASNYYNKVKLALLEKGAAFAEEQVFPSGDENTLRLTPMGKVPFLRVAGGGLSESQAIVEYLEETCPEPPLYPKDVLARAKCRELIEVLELYLEWPARRLYPQAYFGGTASEETKAEVQRALARVAKALPRLTGFETFAFGDRFTYADCAAAMHLPLARNASKLVLGQDALSDVPGLQAYLRRMAERPCVQRVNEDRKAGLEAFAAYRAAKAAAAAARA
ncbi:MAG TPA: glutathione S-transferase [Burkholderiales bacterium]|nr:glutathione S-transferase [Burkholderiales bacterium]